jgi:hypothetical protein
MRRRIRRLGNVGEARAFGFTDVLCAPADCHELTCLVLQIPTPKHLGPVLRDHPDPIGG